MFGLLSQIFLRLVAFAKYVLIGVAILYFVSPYITQFFGFSGLLFLEPQESAWNLSFFPSLISIFSPLFHRSDVLGFVEKILSVETMYWSAVFIRRIFITRFSDVD